MRPTPDRPSRARSRARRDSAVLFALKAPDGVYLAASPAFCEFLGYQVDQVVGKTDFDLLPPAQAEDCRRQESAVASTGQAAVREEAFEGQRGPRRFLVTRSPLRAPGGLFQKGIVFSAVEVEESPVHELVLAHPHPAIHQLLFDNLQEMVAVDRLIFDQGEAVDWVIEDVNPAFERAMGMSRAEVVGRRATEVYGEEARQWLPAYARVVDSGEPARFTRYYNTLRGYYVISAFPLGDNRFATLSMDVTDLKLTERNLRQARDALELKLDQVLPPVQEHTPTPESDRQKAFAERELLLLTRLFNTASIGIAVIQGPQSRYVLVNPTFRAFPGMPQEPLVGRPLLEAFPVTLIPTMRRLIDRAKRTGQPVSVREHETGAVPDRSYWNIELVRLNDDGDAQRVLILAQDVTEHALARRRVEELVADAEFNLSQLEAVVGSIDQGLIIANLKGRILSMNPAGARLHDADPAHIPQDAIQLHKLLELSSDGSSPLDENEGPLARVLRGQSFNAYELYAHNRTTGRRWIGSFSGTQVRNSLGEPILSLVMVQDITDKKRAEEERLQLEASMRNAQKLESLGVLAGGIAHDFNNLLVGIMGNADLSLMQLAEASPIRRLVADIKTAALRAAELTNQMLAYSGRGRTRIEPVDLNQTVNEILGLLRSSISKKARLSLDLSAVLPSIEADATQIRQVVMNLITNASDALSEETGDICVRTGTMDVSKGFLAEAFPPGNQRDGRYIFLEVTDSGGGFDPQTRDRIFDPFFSTKRTGRGLGLAVVLGIVRSHGGVIRADSAPGKGSVFTVLLPYKEGAPMVAAPPPPPENDLEAAPATGVVLVVDDEEIVRDVTRTMLEHAGFKVLTASNGREGIEVMRSHAAEVSAVLLDLTMPVMGGLEAFHEIRRLKANVPVFLVSGYDEREATHQFAGLGLTGFISKPFDYKSLADKIRSVTRSSCFRGLQS